MEVKIALTAEDTIHFIKDHVGSQEIPPMLLSELRATTRRETLLKLYEFLRANVKFKKVSSVEIQVKSVRRLMEDREGNIESLLLAAASILTAMEIPYSFCMVKLMGKDFYSHCYLLVPENEVLEEGYWSLDPLMPNPFLEYKHITFRKIIHP